MIEGMDRVTANMDRLASMSFKRTLERCCLFIENAAKRKAPVGQTGLLRMRISHAVENDEASVFTETEYAPYVEFGTGLFAEAGNGRQDVPWHYQTADGEWHSTIGSKPQPFLRPAVEENRERIEELVKEALGEEIEINVK